ncbi:hypothetical protein H2200_010871 [Cladophialophora chaetospira]|uniref:DUF7924 domain-containing protein n=1 Tax=Cladophialophora chaetospira TaxID=386627 RepID=A0AA38X129_9EURO|nr:hypothetical protein H2200_010871 [Cladophialophora chaetospira]
MAYSSPQLSSAASTRSSQSSQYFPLKDLVNSQVVAPYASSYYQQHTLAPNRINLCDSQLSEEDWSRHAFALGMPSRDIHKPHPDARRFAQKLQRKSRISNKAVTELLVPLIQSATQSSKKLQIKTDTTFHPDAVPNGSPVGRLSNSQNAPWNMPLPVPKPNITVGFSSKNFTQHELELQDGIISNAHGEPCNLGKISQPIVGNNALLWPFLTVDVQSDSLEAAQNASAGSGSTCNNALALLAEAAEESRVRRHGRNAFWQSRTAVHGFSVSVHNDSEGNGKVATLNLHISEGGLSHSCAPIRSYALCNEHDVECLLSRLGSIFIWAENCRLQQIGTLLANLDALVQLESGREHLSDRFTNPDLDMATSYGESLSPGRSKFGVIKNVLTQVSPRWIRVS